MDETLIKELIDVTKRSNTDVRAATRALERERDARAKAEAETGLIRAQLASQDTRIAALEATRSTGQWFREWVRDITSKSTVLQTAIATVIIVTALAFGLRLAPELPTVLSVWRPLVP